MGENAQTVIRSWPENLFSTTYTVMSLAGSNMKSYFVVIYIVDNIWTYDLSWLGVIETRGTLGSISNDDL